MLTLKVNYTTDEPNTITTRRNHYGSSFVWVYLATMKLYLTESQLATIILEAMNVQDIYSKYYSDIDRNLYNKVVTADPTFDGQKMGRYTKWMLGLVRKGNLTEGDLNEATHLLSLFEKYKNRLEVKDVTRLHSMRDLYDVVKPFMEGNQATSKSDEKRQLKNGAEKVYEDGEWIIVIPHTEDAAKLYGKGTKWCTAGDRVNMFDYYNNQGPLYININKKTGKKYQFHFESDQCMDALNRQVKRPVANIMGLTSGALNYYIRERGKLVELRLTTGEEFELHKNFGLLKDKNGECRFVNRNGEIGKDVFIGNVIYNSGYNKFQGFLFDRKLNVFSIENGRLEFDGEAEKTGTACKHIKDCAVCSYIYKGVKLRSELTYRGNVLLHEIRGNEYDNIEAMPVNGIVFFKCDGCEWVPFFVDGMREIKPKKNVYITNCTDFEYRDKRGLYAEVELCGWKHVYKLYTDGELKKTEYSFDEEMEDDENEPDFSTIE